MAILVSMKITGTERTTSVYKAEVFWEPPWPVVIPTVERLTINVGARRYRRVV